MPYFGGCAKNIWSVGLVSCACFGRVHCVFGWRRSFLPPLTFDWDGVDTRIDGFFRHQRASGCAGLLARGGVGCGWCMLARTFSQSPCRPRFDRCIQRRSSWCDFCYRIWVVSGNGRVVHALCAAYWGGGRGGVGDATAISLCQLFWSV